MGRQSILEWFRDQIGRIAFGIFLWSIRKTAIEYWNEIYDQEVRYQYEKVIEKQLKMEKALENDRDIKAG